MIKGNWWRDVGWLSNYMKDICLSFEHIVCKGKSSRKKRRRGSQCDCISHIRFCMSREVCLNILFFGCSLNLCSLLCLCLASFSCFGILCRVLPLSCHSFCGLLWAIPWWIMVFGGWLVCWGVCRGTCLLFGRSWGRKVYRIYKLAPPSTYYYIF